MLFKLSRKGDYGLVLALALAAKNSQSPVSLSKISKDYNLPQNFVARLANSLKRSGILKSKEGFRGGYLLAREPEEITLFEILDALEGPLSPYVCCSEGSCRLNSACPSKGSWADIRQDLTASLKRKTLKDLLGQGGEMYA